MVIIFLSFKWQNIFFNELCVMKIDIFKNLDLQNMLTLEGHTSRVTCLLYPYQLHTRYDPVQLVSGGADFTLCLWDISSGTLLQKFCVQVGEIAQLLVPPANSSVVWISTVRLTKEKRLLTLYI
jgi:WD40 repeat protein